jgi:amidase
VVPADIGNGSWFGMSENGAIATTVADCALVLSVMADRPSLADVTAPARLRVAWSTKVPVPGVPVHADWAAAARTTANVLEQAGHAVERADPDYGATLGLPVLIRWTAGIELDARLLPTRSELAARTRRHSQLGALALRAGFPKDGSQQAWQRRAEQFFSAYDVLVTPALAQPPLKAIGWADRSWLANMVANFAFAPFTAPWNLAGWPAMTVPAGIGATGLPVAVQLIAKPGGEGRLLSVAQQLEQLRPWPRVAPAFADRDGEAAQ